MEQRTRLRLVGIVLAVMLIAGVTAMGVVAWREVQAARAAAGR